MTNDEEMEYEKTLEMAKKFLKEAGLLDEGLKIIKKSMAPGVPFKVLELMDDEDRIDSLLEDAAEVYVEAGFTAAELEAILTFYKSDVGQKLVKLNTKIMPRTGEITMDWVYDIIEEVQKSNEENSDVIETDETEPAHE